jgi:hypothetical protein
VSGRARLAASATLWLAQAAPAVAGPASPVEVAARMWRSIEARIDALVAATRPAPPQPVTVDWGPVSLGALALADGLLDLDAGDLDGDGAAELVALTAGEVVVLRVADGALVELARAALPLEPAVPRPRWPVGTVRIVDRGIVAHGSARALGARYELVDGALRERERVAWFPLCADALVGALVPGRHLLDGTSIHGWEGELPAALWTARCSRGVVDATGVTLAALGVVSADGAGFVALGPACGSAPCGQVALRFDLPRRVGAALAVGDLDRDGRVDVVTTEPSPPGVAEAVEVFELHERGPTSVYRTPPFTGGVVGAAIGDLEGDGVAEAVVAVRGVAAEVVLWTLAR